MLCLSGFELYSCWQNSPNFCTRARARHALPFSFFFSDSEKRKKNRLAVFFFSCLTRDRAREKKRPFAV